MLFVLFVLAVIAVFALVTHHNVRPESSISTCVDRAANPDYLASRSEQDAIAAINNARAQEHLGALRLPSNYYQLDPPRQQFILINLERTDRGLKPLKMDANLALMARGYSQQLRDLQFFSHTSPIAGTFSERINSNAAVVNHYALAAENLAGNPVPGAGAVYEYMYDDSVEVCGHRDTILDPGLTLVGIGWVPGGVYGSISAQEFLGSASWNPYVGTISATAGVAPLIGIVEVPQSESERRATTMVAPTEWWQMRMEADVKVTFRVLEENGVALVRVTWFLDHIGNAAHRGMTLTLDVNHLAPGTHTLLVYVVDGEEYYGVARVEIVM